MGVSRIFGVTLLPDNCANVIRSHINICSQFWSEYRKKPNNNDNGTEVAS